MSRCAFESLDGLISAGEFCSLLLGFRPVLSRRFRLEVSADLRKVNTLPSYIRTASRALTKSHYMVGARASAGNLVAAAGYHGEVVLDSEASRALRLSAFADDIPSTSGILQSSVEVDYDFVDVAGHNYLLPSRSESHMERKYRQIANEVTFGGYRKFDLRRNRP
jgi:hypothetical protein